MDKKITFSTKEILRQNKCQMGFLHKFALKNFDQKLMMNAITSSMLEFPSTSDYDEVENPVSKSNVFRTNNQTLNKRNQPWQQGSTKYGDQR